MNRKFTIFILVLLILLTAVPAMAAPPLEMHIEVTATIDPADADPFTASGPAADAGLLCPNGDVYDLEINASGPPEGSFINLRVLKHFVCADGSGTFDVKLNAKVDFVAGGTTGNWVIVNGTGDYVGVHGSGKLTGIVIVLGESILDIYDGQMH